MSRHLESHPLAPDALREDLAPAVGLIKNISPITSTVHQFQFSSCTTVGKVSINSKNETCTR